MYEISEESKNEQTTKRLLSKPSNGTRNFTATKVSPVPRTVNFASGMLEHSNLKQPRKSVDLLISLLTQTAIVVLLVLLPLLYTHALNVPEFNKTMLLIPPPPPPPPPARPVHVLTEPKVSLFEEGKLVAPKVIPKHVAVVKEAQEPPPGPPGISGGVPGGVAGGTLGGVLGGILSSATPPVAPPPKPVKSNKPLRVGGRVQAPRLIRKIEPLYPELAKETRTQGSVVLDCVIDKQGNVTQMKLLSGHPLLVDAAFRAVRQWKYQPTLLNGEPVAVEMTVTVNFTLGE